jgi:hypothetical protein
MTEVFKVFEVFLLCVGRVKQRHAGEAVAGKNDKELTPELPGV